jgi:hypothetical protein
LPFGVRRIDGAYQRTRSARPEEGGDHAFVIAGDDCDAVADADADTGKVGVGMLNSPAEISPCPSAAPILDRGQHFGQIL